MRARQYPLLIALICACAWAATAAASAGAATPAADCQPYGAHPCLLPFPDNRLTRADRTSATHRRLNLPAAAMPKNTAGVRISPREYNRLDGFSPGSALIVHVPGLDTPAAFRRTNPVGLLDESRSFARSAPIVVIDEATGRRQLIWTELDANAPNAASTNVLIHPGVNFLEGHTYAVALRSLRTARGHTIAAPAWFAALRDRRVHSARYDHIFSVLTRAGISRAGLTEAWDFTVGSAHSLAGRLLSIRNQAFATLGDRNLRDVRVSGRAPGYAISSVDQLTPTLRRVQGSFQIPCYLITCGPTATTGFHFASGRIDALPSRLPGNTATAPFECIIPSSATPAHPARISLYGHGLLGSHGEVEAGNVEAMATEHNTVFCATDWWGLAEGDTGYDAGAVADLNRFPAVVDRLQQGVVNTLFLGRLLLHPQGLAANPAFQASGHPLINLGHLFYDGNSQGGIEGGLTTAVAPDYTRAVLGVSGMNYGNVLVQRSTDFAPFASILLAHYPDRSQYPAILDVIQQLWDRGDPDGYAQHMTTHPYPDTPAHQVLMQIAYGDHQVSMYAAAVEARTIGARVHTPALDPARSRDRNLFYGIPAAPGSGYRGSAISIWDSGPGIVQPPPVANLAPVDGPTNHDPHEHPRSTPAARVQKDAFLASPGLLLDTCVGRPCHSAAYVP
jgi:hypothetical protein